MASSAPPAAGREWMRARPLIAPETVWFQIHDTLVGRECGSSRTSSFGPPRPDRRPRAADTHALQPYRGASVEDGAEIRP